MGHKKDINTLWGSMRDLERSVQDKLDSTEAKVSENNTDLKLLAKDVKDSIDGMRDFMALFKQHDEKEMAKYDSINKSVDEMKEAFKDELHAVNTKLDAYITATKDQPDDIAVLKKSAEKSSTFTKRVTWTVSILTTVATILWLIFPSVNSHMKEQAILEAKVKESLQPKVFTVEEKMKYYDKKVSEAASTKALQRQLDELTNILNDNVLNKRKKEHE